MDIIRQIIQCLHKEPSYISERLMVFEAEFKCFRNDLLNVEDLFSIIKNFPSRDNAKISFANDNDGRYTFSNQKDNDKDSLQEFLQEIDFDEEEIRVRIEIDKKIANNTFSVYCMKLFSADLIAKKTCECMAAFNKLLFGLDYLVFEIFDENCLFSTNTMLFKSVSQESTAIEFSRKSKLEAAKKTTYFYGNNGYDLIPDDFKINVHSENNPLREVFTKLKTILSLIYIASSASIEDGILKLQISGQRNLDFSYEIDGDNFQVKNDELFHIYDWIYTDGNPTDKAIIARNIISLHCKYSQLIDTDEKTYASIQSNYAVYQKNNAAEYLDVKNKLAKFIIDLVSQTGDISLGLADRLKNNLMSFLTFIITVLLTKIASSSATKTPLNVDSIITKEIAIIMYVILAGSMLFVWASWIEVNHKIQKLSQGYDSLKESYSEILDENDIKNIFKEDKIFKENVAEVVNFRRKLVIGWGVLVAIIFVVVECLSSSPLLWSLIKSMTAKVLF